MMNTRIKRGELTIMDIIIDIHFKNLNNDSRLTITPKGTVHWFQHEDSEIIEKFKVVDEGIILV